MRRSAGALALVLLGLAGGEAAAGEAAVTMEQGLVSAAFDGVAARDAVEAVRRATGVELVLPASAQQKTLTLAVERVPLEQFLRRLLEGLDLGGFALVYEANGAAQRVIVVDRAKGGAAPVETATTAPPSPTPAAPVPSPTEPVYIPPAAPPVYIPPRTPPVYIPPATPPVYVPPATLPREVPPGQ